MQDSRTSGRVRPRHPAQKVWTISRAPWTPLEALRHWIFCFFSSFYVQFSKTSPLESGESSEKSSGENRVKSCPRLVAVMVFSAPENTSFARTLLGSNSWGASCSNKLFVGTVQAYPMHLAPLSVCLLFTLWFKMITGRKKLFSNYFRGLYRKIL